MRDCLDQVDLSVYSWRIALIHLTEVDTCPQWVSAFPTKTLDCAIVERARRALVCVLTTYSPLLTLDVWCRSSYFPFPPPRFLHAMALWAKITSFLTKLIGQGILSHQRQMKLKTVGQSQPFVLLRDSIDWMEINHSVGGNVFYSESSNKKLISSQNSITERLRIIFNWIFGHPGYYSWAELTQD